MYPEATLLGIYSLITVLYFFECKPLSLCNNPNCFQWCFLFFIATFASFISSGIWLVYLIPCLPLLFLCVRCFYQQYAIDFDVFFKNLIYRFLPLTASLVYLHLLLLIWFLPPYSVLFTLLCLSFISPFHMSYWINLLFFNPFFLSLLVWLLNILVLLLVIFKESLNLIFKSIFLFFLKNAKKNLDILNSSHPFLILYNYVVLYFYSCLVELNVMIVLPVWEAVVTILQSFLFNLLPY